MGGGGFPGPMGGGPPGFGGLNPGGTLARSFIKAGDTDDDEDLSAAEFLALGEKWFRQWDLGRNGFLTEAAVTAGLADVLEKGSQSAPGSPRAPAAGPGKMLASGLMKAADADQDGRITPAEWNGAFSRWFRQWDSDRDGVLSRGELAKGLGNITSAPGIRPPTGTRP